MLKLRRSGKLKRASTMLIAEGSLRRTRRRSPRNTCRDFLTATSTWIGTWIGIGKIRLAHVTKPCDLFDHYLIPPDTLASLLLFETDKDDRLVPSFCIPSTLDMISRLPIWNTFDSIISLGPLSHFSSSLYISHHLPFLSLSTKVSIHLQHVAHANLRSPLFRPL